MKIIKNTISLREIKSMAEKSFGNMVKAVVDAGKEIMALDANLHSDEETLLLQNGSKQENLWGINLYPDLKGNDFIEFDSIINIRPIQNNRTRGIDNSRIKEKIIKIVHKLIDK